MSISPDHKALFLRGGYVRGRVGWPATAFGSREDLAILLPWKSVSLRSIFLRNIWLKLSIPCFICIQILKYTYIIYIYIQIYMYIYMWFFYTCVYRYIHCIYIYNHIYIHPQLEIFRLEFLSFLTGLLWRFVVLATYGFSLPSQQLTTGTWRCFSNKKEISSSFWGAHFQVPVVSFRGIHLSIPERVSSFPAEGCCEPRSFLLPAELIPGNFQPWISFNVH